MLTGNKETGVSFEICAIELMTGTGPDGNVSGAVSPIVDVEYPVETQIDAEGQ